MASLKALKIRIGSVKSTQKITKAMKMVAAEAAPRAAERGGGRPYSSRMTEVVAVARLARHGRAAGPKLLAGTGGGTDPDRRRHRRPRPRRRLQHQHRPRGSPQDRRADRAGKTVLFYIVGRKGRPVIQRLYPKSDHRPVRHERDEGADLRGRAGDREGHHRPLQTDGIDVVHLAYANFRSTLVQEPVVEQIIPVPPRRRTRPAKAQAPVAVEYEPDEEEILADLLPRNIAIQLYRALLENQAGFYGSQMTAMDNATRNAGDMINKLSIQYNRQRQAAITTELIEIISAPKRSNEPKARKTDMATAAEPRPEAAPRRPKRRPRWERPARRAT